MTRTLTIPLSGGDAARPSAAGGARRPRRGVKTFVTGELAPTTVSVRRRRGVFVLPKQVRDFRAANPDLKL